MDKQVLIDAGFDYEGGLSRCMGDKALYEKLLGMFKRDRSFERLQDGMARESIKDAFEGAHSLKGVAGNLGMTELYNTDVELTEALRGEGDMAKAKELYPAVIASYEKAMEAIKDIKEPEKK